MTNNNWRYRNARIIQYGLFITIVILSGGCTQTIITSKQTVTNRPIEFRFIRATIEGIYGPTSAWEIELIPKSQVAHKRIGDTETEETVTLSESDIARINNALTKAHFLELPDRVGEVYADVGEITIYVESGDERKTIKTCPGQHMTDPQAGPVMELWVAIQSIFPNKQ